MYGAILGDIVGSVYEGRGRAIKTKDFPLFGERCRPTDDSIMSLAVADAFLACENPAAPDDDELNRNLVSSMQRIGRKYIKCGFGGKFIQWICSENPEPYNSFGNGSAMRVSSVAWLVGGDVDDEAARERVLHYAKCSADVTHNHPEGVKGAQSVALAIHMARFGHSKEEIRSEIESRFGYDLHRSCDEIRPGYSFHVSCQRSVPESIIAFLESSDVEDAVRIAVSMGGDTDTMGAIAGSIAEAFYGVPEVLKAEVRNRLKPDLAEILKKFDDFLAAE